MNPRSKNSAARDPHASPQAPAAGSADAKTASCTAPKVVYPFPQYPQRQQ